MIILSVDIGRRKMKAILEFNLPEDREAFEVASKAMDWSLVVWDMEQHLRKKLKYDNDYETPNQALEHMRETLNELLVDKGLIYPS